MNILMYNGVFEIDNNFRTRTKIYGIIRYIIHSIISYVFDNKQTKCVALWCASMAALKPRVLFHRILTLRE